MSKAIHKSTSKVKKITLKEQGNITPESLYKIITKKDGKPDHIAIAIYVEVRSWFKLKKTKVDGNVIYSSKLKGHGFQTGYEHFITKYQCTSETIRTKFVLLEELGLITRDFRTEYFYGKRFNNLMYILLWKDTPHFYSEIGLEKPKKVSTTYPENQGDLSQNSLTPIQKNLDNIYVIPNNHLEEQESLKSSLSSSFKEVPILIKSTACAQETENTTCSNAVLTEHSQVGIPEPKEDVTVCDDTNKPKFLTASEEKIIHLERVQRTPEDTGMSNFIQLMNKVLNQPEPIAQEEIPAMKQKEQNPIPDKETRKMLLSKAIFDAFGAASNEIQDNCSFEELEHDKVNIKPGLGVSFNDIEKAKIRRCIQSVYGEDVKLVLAKTQAVVTTGHLGSQSVLVSNSCNNPQWLRFKAELTKVLLKKHEEKIAIHIFKNWFDKLRVSDDSTSQKLILVGSVCVIQWIDDKFGMELENTVLASDLTIELRDEDNRNRPLIFSKQTIKRG